MKQHEIDLLVEKTIQSMKKNEVAGQEKITGVDTLTSKPNPKIMSKPIQRSRHFLRPKITNFSTRIVQLLSSL